MLAQNYIYFCGLSALNDQNLEHKLMSEQQIQNFK